jgi:hypothetical protein
MDDTQRLAALEEELRRDLEAITRVRRMMDFKSGLLTPSSAQRELPLSPAGTFSFNPVNAMEGPEDEDARPSTSLRGMIEQIINMDPSVRWTTQKVLAHLQQVKFPLRAAKPIYSVGQALQGLVRTGKIRLARKGSGSEPNIYKGRIPDAKQAETEGSSLAQHET